jgi:hypothetical protein
MLALDMANESAQLVHCGRRGAGSGGLVGMLHIKLNASHRVARNVQDYAIYLRRLARIHRPSPSPKSIAQIHRPDPSLSYV